MNYSKSTHGRTSQKSPATDALREEWRMAAELNAQGGEGEWVPRDAVYTRADILPRAGDYLDHGKVKEYADVFRQLPPITVQRDTFVLIDGRHRLNAAYESAATSLHIRIVEADVPDAELREAAWQANVGHGVPYRLKDRLEHLKYLLSRKDGRTDGELAAVVGLNRSTVMDNRHRVTGYQRDMGENSRHNRSSSESGQPVSVMPAPAYRPESQPSKPTARDARDIRRQPDGDPEWEEPARQVEDGPDSIYNDYDGSVDNMEYGDPGPEPESPRESAARKLDALAPRPGYAPDVPDGLSDDDDDGAWEDIDEIEDSPAVPGEGAPGGSDPAPAAFPFDHWLGRLMQLPDVMPVPDGGEPKQIDYALGVLEQHAADCLAAIRALKRVAYPCEKCGHVFGLPTARDMHQKHCSGVSV